MDEFTIHKHYLYHKEANKSRKMVRIRITFHFAGIFQVIVLVVLTVLKSSQIMTSRISCLEMIISCVRQNAVHDVITTVSSVLPLHNTHAHIETISSHTHITTVSLPA